MNQDTGRTRQGLHFQQSGQGPALIILHGLFGSGRNWHSVARRLEQQFQVITVDLRNHGDSPHLPGMDYLSMAGDIRALMQELQLETASILGHSMGGKVAMSLALRHPQRVSRLIVVDIAPVNYRHDFHAIFTSMKDLDLNGLKNRRQAQDYLQERLEDPVLTAFLLQNLQREAQGYHWRVNLSALEQGMEAISGFPEELLQDHFDGPTLFIAGAESRHVRPQHRALIERLFPAARIHTIPAAGHWPHTEQPQAFMNLLHDYLHA